MTETIAAEQDSLEFQRGLIQGRHQTCLQSQAILAALITDAQDRYNCNKGSDAGLVAFGQLVALRGAAERLAWTAAQQ